MATATKTARTIVSSTATTTGANGTLSLTTALGCLVTCRVTNGGTGPSSGCLVTINTSNDNSGWREFAPYRAGADASTTYDWTVEIPAPAMYVQVTFGSTSQSVTVEALGQELTSIS